jgi:hypothetical protein
LPDAEPGIGGTWPAQPVALAAKITGSSAFPEAGKSFMNLITSVCMHRLITLPGACTWFRL